MPAAWVTPACRHDLHRNCSGLQRLPGFAFAQNVGLVALTDIKSRFAVAAGGVILLILGLSPMAATAFALIPQPVLGGAGIVLFGTVAASGVRTLSKVNYQGNNNLVVVATSIAFGLIPVVSADFIGTPSRLGS